MYNYLIIILSEKYHLPLEIINMIIFNFDGLQHPIVNIFKNNSIPYFYKKGHLLSNIEKQAILPYWNLTNKILCLLPNTELIDPDCGCIWCKN